MYVAKTKALISFAVTAKLICVFVLAYEKSPFSHDATHLLLFQQAGHGSDAIKSCSDLLEMDPDSLEGLCDRAEAHIANEDYDEGIII